MNKDELKIEINKLKYEYKQKCRELRVSFAMQHNPVKVGDIIKKTSFPELTIKVNRIEVPDYGDFGTPDCLYHGYIVSKITGQERTDLSEESLYQRQIEFINGEPYKYIIE